MWISLILPLVVGSGVYLGWRIGQAEKTEKVAGEDFVGVWSYQSLDSILTARIHPEGAALAVLLTVGSANGCTGQMSGHGKIKEGALVVQDATESSCEVSLTLKGKTLVSEEGTCGNHGAFCSFNGVLLKDDAIAAREAGVENASASPSREADSLPAPQESSASPANTQSSTLAVTTIGAGNPPAPFTDGAIQRIDAQADLEGMQSELALAGDGTPESIAIVAKHLAHAFADAGYSFDETILMYFTHKPQSMLMHMFMERTGAIVPIGSALMGEVYERAIVKTGAISQATIDAIKASEPESKRRK